MVSRGLATIALLKTNFDEGHDHIQMFQPFLIDVISDPPKDDFEIAEVQAALNSRHGLKVPVNTLQVLLKRATKRRLLTRQWGRYFRQPNLPQPNLAKATAKIKADHSTLAAHLSD